VSAEDLVLAIKGEMKTRQGKRKDLTLDNKLSKVRRRLLLNLAVKTRSVWMNRTNGGGLGLKSKLKKALGWMQIIRRLQVKEL
jgi:hypothetical protein